MSGQSNRLSDSITNNGETIKLLVSLIKILSSNPGAPELSSDTARWARRVLKLVKFSSLSLRAAVDDLPDEIQVIGDNMVRLLQQHGMSTREDAWYRAAETLGVLIGNSPEADVVGHASTYLISMTE